ncbi:hypothetical protein ACFQZX_00300 [Mucilaginibacter litoreus]|uniref:Uncharacterized protein n=1 Tax=Mucilaginibacter litoreus TaxID=1048221 RepID=A0ABW3AMY1_9SPHI
MGFSKEKGKRLKGKGSRKVLAFAVLGSCFLVLGSAERSSAQTFAEWWSQKKTQISYLNQQIAALMVYGGYLKAGYNISQQGLGSIGGWVKAELDLHTARYAALRQVNPVIRDDGRAAAIAGQLEGIVRALTHLDVVSGLSASDRLYLGQVKAKVQTECEAEAAELELVIKRGEAELTDEERLERLGKVEAAVKDMVSFTAGYSARVRALVLQRAQEQRGLSTVRRWYGFQ